MFVVLEKLKKTNFKVNDILSIDLDSISDDFLIYCTKQVLDVFRNQVKETNKTEDVVAKTSDFLEKLLNSFKAKTNSKLL